MGVGVGGGGVAVRRDYPYRMSNVMQYVYHTCTVMTIQIHCSLVYMYL